MFENLKKLWVQLFTNEKFPTENRDSVGGKTIGDVYDIQYMPSPDNPGEVVFMFIKNEDQE